MAQPGKPASTVLPAPTLSLVTPEKRQTLATLGIVGALALVIGALFLAVGNKDVEPLPPGATPTTAPTTAAPTDSVVVATPPGLDIPDVEKYLRENCVAQPVEEKFVAVSYNIKSGHAYRGSSLARIAASLKEMDPAIVLLQEVDKNRSGSGHVDQPAYLAKALGMTYAYGVNVRRGSQQYGTAVLSSYPIVPGTGSNAPLPNAAGRQPRGLLHIVVNVRGLELSVFNTHLDFHGDSLKAAQMRRAAQLIAADTRPRLVGGDLNAPPGSAAVAAARNVADDPFPLVGRGSADTSPGNAPRSRIDYLFHRGAGLTALAADVPAVALSDHRPVRVAYQLTGTPTCAAQQ